ncbi:unnamed protein product [Ranitomeya imitator]|uniref:TBC1 domain family member 4 n=1 Tax=Ranitomeya imitator TaxID=111125 RepID=A0ABN9LYA8_9NEOB|nr:unnamed protein product [Ranitomeya imitator]
MSEQQAFEMLKFLMYDLAFRKQYRPDMMSLQVSTVISSIRQVSKVALKEDSKPNKDSEDAFYNSQKFEVLYCGKVVIAHKNAPLTLIDDCIEKFSLHERQRLKLLSEQRSVDSSCDLTLAETNFPLSPSDSTFQDLDTDSNANSASRNHSGIFTVGSQNNLAGMRVSFPERILEDSGFDDQQEFRSRCSSVTIQKKGYDGKVQSRRRHASAPSHVQPSDSEKNRTMLFQVGRFEINLISPDTKSVVLEKNFKDISSCSQTSSTVQGTRPQGRQSPAGLEASPESPCRVEVYL